MGDVGALDRIDRRDRRAARAQRRVAKCLTARARHDASRTTVPPRLVRVASTTTEGVDACEWVPHSKLQMALVSASPDAHTFRRRLLQSRSGESTSFLIDEVGRHGAGLVCAAREVGGATVFDALACALKRQPSPLIDAAAASRRFSLFGVTHANASQDVADTAAHGAVAERISCELVYVDETVPLFFLTRTPVDTAPSCPSAPLVDMAAAARVGVGTCLFEKLCTRACKIFGIYNIFI